MWWLVPVAIAGALIIVLFVDGISRIIMNKKLSIFLDNYKLISFGMTKQQIVEIMGIKYVHNATLDIETLSWSCDTNTSIQRELYSKKEAKRIITVEFSGNKVISYNLK